MWVVDGFSIGIPSGEHYRITRTDDPLTLSGAGDGAGPLPEET